MTVENLLDELYENWLKQVNKSMATHKTKGTFTKWCTDHSFKKASYNCIANAIQVADDILSNKDSTDAERSGAILLKKRATLAKTFKKMAHRRKSK